MGNMGGREVVLVAEPDGSEVLREPKRLLTFLVLVQSGETT